MTLGGRGGGWSDLHADDEGADEINDTDDAVDGDDVAVTAPPDDASSVDETDGDEVAETWPAEDAAADDAAAALGSDGSSGADVNTAELALEASASDGRGAPLDGAAIGAAAGGAAAAVVVAAAAAAAATEAAFDASRSDGN